METTIDIAEVETLLARLAEINRIPIEDIQWTRDGVRMSFPPAWINDWKFIGLVNTDFISTGYYLEGPGEWNKE